MDFGCSLTENTLSLKENFLSRISIVFSILPLLHFPSLLSLWGEWKDSFIRWSVSTPKSRISVTLGALHDLSRSSLCPTHTHEVLFLGWWGKQQNRHCSTSYLSWTSDILILVFRALYMQLCFKNTGTYIWKSYPQENQVLLPPRAGHASIHCTDLRAHVVSVLDLLFLPSKFAFWAQKTPQKTCMYIKLSEDFC